MLLNWQKSESYVMPLEIDCTLSDSGVYLRKNIRTEQVEDDENVNTKYVYDETILPNDFRYNILDMDEYKAKLLEDLKKEMLIENEGTLELKQYISTSKGDFNIKTPTYDFIFCLMALKDLPTGVPEGTIRYYNGTPAPAMTQAEIQELYAEFVQAISVLDAKFTAIKNQIINAESFDELFSINIEY